MNQGKTKISSVIDIDSLYDINKTANIFFNDYLETIELAHTKEKELFFSLLTDPFLESLKPSYKE